MPNCWHTRGKGFSLQRLIDSLSRELQISLEEIRGGGDIRGNIDRLVGHVPVHGFFSLHH